MECGDGWFSLLQDLSLRLEGICEAQVAVGEVPLLASQLKKKFGGLRFYLDDYNEEARALIEEAKERARQTCDICGGPGSLRTVRGWLTTRCDRDAEAPGG